MKLFKHPGIRGLFYAGLFTIFPYVIGFLLIWPQNDTSGLGAAFFRLIIVIGTPPLWLITTLLTPDNDSYFYYVYPLFSFFVWYLIVLVIVYFLGRVKKQKTKW